MNKKHQNQDSSQTKGARTAHALSEAAQAQAFDAFAAARHALRSHLHGSYTATRHIIDRARAAASGATGTKNDTKKYFQKGGPTKEQVRNCETAENSNDISDALHALGGKQALYWECLSMAQKDPCPRSGNPGDYERVLKSCKTAYLRTRDVAVTQNLALATWEVTKIGATRMEFEDLMQHAAIGVQKAVEGFNPSSGRFSTYAVPVIKGEIIRALENFGQEVRLPSHVWTKMRRYDQTKEALTFAFGRTPTPQEIALEMGIPVREAVCIHQYHFAPISMESPIGSEEGDMKFGDTLVDFNAQIPGEDYMDHAA